MSKLASEKFQTNEEKKLKWYNVQKQNEFLLTTKVNLKFQNFFYTNAYSKSSKN